VHGRFLKSRDRIYARTLLDLDDLDDEKEIEKRYIEVEYPLVEDILGSQIIYNYWSLVYETVEECAKDLMAPEESQAMKQL
jgi:hypothetical protein